MQKNELQSVILKYVSSQQLVVYLHHSNIFGLFGSQGVPNQWSHTPDQMTWTQRFRVNTCTITPLIESIHNMYYVCLNKQF